MSYGRPVDPAGAYVQQFTVGVSPYSPALVTAPALHGAQDPYESAVDSNAYQVAVDAKAYQVAVDSNAYQVAVDPRAYQVAVDSNAYQVAGDARAYESAVDPNAYQVAVDARAYQVAADACAQQYNPLVTALVSGYEVPSDTSLANNDVYQAPQQEPAYAGVSYAVPVETRAVEVLYDYASQQETGVNLGAGSTVPASRGSDTYAPAGKMFFSVPGLDWEEYSDSDAHYGTVGQFYESAENPAVYEIPISAAPSGVVYLPGTVPPKQDETGPSFVGE
jgi:hypothetical protein